MEEFCVWTALLFAVFMGSNLTKLSGKITNMDGEPFFHGSHRASNRIYSMKLKINHDSIFLSPELKQHLIIKP